MKTICFKTQNLEVEVFVINKIEILLQENNAQSAIRKQEK
jgi:hypothetical protein